MKTDKQNHSPQRASEKNSSEAKCIGNILTNTGIANGLNSHPADTSKIISEMIEIKEYQIQTFKNLIKKGKGFR